MLKRNLVANYAGQAWSAVMGLAFIPVYIHYLGVEAYGLIGLFAVLQAWLALLDMGLTPTLAREMGRYTGVPTPRRASATCCAAPNGSPPAWPARWRCWCGAPPTGWRSTG